jgi:hypothetical protein
MNYWYISYVYSNKKQSGMGGGLISQQTKTFNVSNAIWFFENKHKEKTTITIINIIKITKSDFEKNVLETNRKKIKNATTNNT